MIATTRASYAGSRNKNHSVEFIKNSLSPLEFYQHELQNVPLTQHGWIDGGLCPFHHDTKAGSFKVNLVTGGFNCFACGVKGGDIIAFTMKLYGLDFVEALGKIADDWGLV
jgi:DNA primase